MAKSILDFWKQAAADITDTSSILDTSAVLDRSAVLDTSAILDINEILGLNNNSEENLNDSNILLNVFCTDPYHKNSIIKENEIIYISSEPKMPDINIEIEISQYFNDIKFGEKLFAVLEIKYSVDQGKGNQRKFRNDIQRYPINEGYVFNIKEQSIFGKFEKFDKRIFKINILPKYSNIFRGGEATLKIYNSNNILLKKFIFNIRGINPSKQELRSYLEEKGFLHDYWFIGKIFISETLSKDLNFVQHFYDPQGAPKKTTGINYNSNLGGTPIWGYPDGWGIGQIDHDGVINTDRYLDPNLLWNWKLNIEQVVEDLKFKIQDANRIILNHINRFKKANKDKLFSAPSVLQENITYLQAPSEIKGVTVNDYFKTTTPIGINEKSIIDAQIIREYNGGSFLIGIELDENGNGVWKWSDYYEDAKGNKIYYVKRISIIED